MKDPQDTPVLKEIDRLVGRIMTFGEISEQTWTVPKTHKTRKANREWHRKRFVEAISELIATKERESWTKGWINGRITGLLSARRYKGNPFTVAQKIDKEINRLRELRNTKVEK